MSLIMTEPCDENPAPVAWDSTSGASIIVAAGDRYPGDSSGFCWTPSTTSTRCVLGKSFSADADSTVVIGAAIKVQSTLGNGSFSDIFRLFDAGFINQRCTVWAVGAGVSTGHKIQVRAGSTSGGTLLAGTSVAVIDASAWYYLEVKVVCNSSTGSVNIKVNEINVASVSGIDTTGGFAGSTFGTVQWGVTDSNISPHSWDDFYLLNGAGSTNNDFLGDVRVIRLRPNAAGSSSGFTPGGSGNDGTNHYENVNDTPIQASHYNASGVDETDEYYNYPNLPASITGTIFGVQQKKIANCSALNVGMAHILKDSTTESESSEFALSTTVPSTSASAANTAVTFSRCLDTKPSGGSWTVSEVNAMQSGARIKSIT